MPAEQKRRVVIDFSSVRRINEDVFEYLKAGLVCCFPVGISITGQT
jgi:anti-anti-sigma regulatory factor